MLKIIWNDYMMPIVLITTALLCLLIGLILIGTFPNGFSIIKNNVGQALQTAKNHLQAGLVFTVLLTPIFGGMALLWAIYIYWMQRF